jgi:hypothetical protein
MLRKLLPHLSFANVTSVLALFVALGGTSAYAVNEWNGTNIQDETLTGVDVKGKAATASTAAVNGGLTGADISGQAADPALSQPFVQGSLTGSDVKDSSLATEDIRNNSLGNGDFLTGSVDSRVVTDDSLGNGDFLTGSVDSRVVTDDSVTSGDVKNFSLGNGDFLTGSVDSRVVTDDSVTGTDINESTLNMPPTTTASFAGPSGSVLLSDSFTKVAGKTLPAGSYAIIATANTETGVPFAGDRVSDTACELRNGSNFIGGATDRRVIKNGDKGKVSLSMNGGAQVPAGGGEASLWCLSQLGGSVNYGQMMIIRLDGFS